MARAAKTPKKVPDEPVNDEAIALEDALDFAAISPQLSAIQAEMGDAWDGASWKMHVAKILPDAKEARVWDGPPEDYNLMDIARKFGSGDYRVKMYGPHESGRVVIRGSNVTAVLLSAEEDTRVNESRNPVKVNGGAAFDPLSFAQAVATAVAQAVAPLVAKQSNPLEDLKGLAEVIKTVMPVQPVAQSTGNTFLEMLNGMKAIQELSRSMNPVVPVDSEGKADVPGMALNKGLDLVARLMEKHMEDRPAAISAPSGNVIEHPAQNSKSATPENQAATQPEIGEDAMFEAQKAKLALEMLNMKATRKANARDEAEEIYEDVPEGILEMLCVEPQWFDYVCQIVPECKPNKEWFELLRLRIYEMAVEDGIIDAAGKYVLPHLRPGVSELPLTDGPKLRTVAGDGTSIQPATGGNGSGSGKPD